MDNTDEIGGPYTDPGPGGAFVAVPLIDDETDPGSIVFRKGIDRVSGIYAESTAKVLIVTQGDGQSATRGGAVFKATSTTTTSVAYSSSAEAPDFFGIEKAPGGYIALSSARHLVASSDGGASFSRVAHGAIDAFGTERMLALRVSSRGSTLVRDVAVISTAPGAPSATTDYTEIWAPELKTPIPARQAGFCVHGPHAPQPTLRYGVHVTDDASFLAYVSTDKDSHPEICVSADAGRTFRAYALEVPTAADGVPPTGVAFATRKTGIAWFGSSSGGTYLRRTINGGTVWRTVALPAEVASHNLELPGGFFAPDGNTGWLVGYDHTASEAVALRTFDRGATWAVVPGVAAAVADARGNKLFVGFAVDATHIWLGGDRGVVLHN